MLENILLYSEFSCGIILLLFALLQITYRNREFLNLNLAGLYFCLSYVILSMWAFKSGLILHFPWLLYTDISMAFAIGPFVFFYIRAVIGQETDSGYRFYLHLIPACLIFCAIVLHNIMDKSLTDYYMRGNARYQVYHLSAFIWIIDLISSFYMIMYFIPAIRNLYRLLRMREHKSIRELGIVSRYLSLVLIFSALMLLAELMKNDLLNIIAIYLLTFSGIWYFLFSFRYPDFAQKAIKEARIIRYSRSMTGGIDEDVILERLKEIMRDEKIFTDEHLTLQKLSAQLMVTPHQLSRILNSRLQMNFRTLVNSYRISEAKSLMKNFPDRNILNIALECGFNSKSSFNSVFSKTTGVTPSAYRKGLDDGDGDHI
jgi:AraC-like DNA-binding protein